MLEHEMAIEQDRLDLGEQRIVAVDVGPAGLHHADLWISEMVNALQEEVGRRNKVGVEDGDELALRGLQASFEGSGFVAFAIGAVEVDHRISERGVAIDEQARDFHGFVGRIVEQLDVELVFRVIEAADGIEKAVDYVLLIEDRQLHGDARQFGKVSGRFGRLVLLVLVIKIDQPVAVSAIGRQDDEDDEVGNQQGEVESIDLVKALESLVQKMLA